MATSERIAGADSAITGPVIRTHDASQTRRCGELLAGSLRADDVVALSGDLGAGKTCLVKGVAEGLGLTESVTSPTFNILVVHGSQPPLHHFDLYRLERAGQLEDVDFFGMLEAGGVSLIEWGDRFPEALPADHLVVALTMVNDTDRELRVEAHGERSRALAGAWLDACESDGLEVERR